MQSSYAIQVYTIFNDDRFLKNVPLPGVGAMPNYFWVWKFSNSRVRLDFSLL
jgi:hypothetical protein